MEKLNINMYSQRARGIAHLLAAEICTPIDFELFHATIFEVSFFLKQKKTPIDFEL